MRRALFLVAVAGLAALASPAGSAAHQGDPHYRSEVKRVAPSAAGGGISVRALGFDDRLELTNRSGRAVVVRGYEGEPYARVLADGTVQANLNSPAYYVNDDRFGRAKVPAGIGPDLPPRWKTLDRTGVFSWHDHRAHWMGNGTPPQVGDESRRTKIFDYRVPLRVDGRPAAIVGSLYWVGVTNGPPMPVPAIVALVVAAVLAVGAALVVRRRRRAG